MMNSWDIRKWSCGSNPLATQRLLLWRHVRGAAIVALCLVAAACQTSTPVDEAAAPPAPQQFTPTTFLSQIHVNDSRYPDLYAPSSYAVWVGSEVAEQKRAAVIAKGQQIEPGLDKDAVSIMENYLLIECSLASGFGDMSVAYDAVGLRGVTAYLLLPDGRKINPVQTVLGLSRPDSQAGALKVFERTNLFVFPLTDLATGKPVIDPKAPSMRLMLEYQNSSYYFEWESDLGKTELPTALQKAKELIERVDYNELFGQVRRLAHVFD